MLKGIGVRGRLLVAFFGISAFAVLASAAAVYSFLAVGGVLDRILNRRAARHWISNAQLPAMVILSIRTDPVLIPPR